MAYGGGGSMPLPMLQLKQMGSRVTGVYAPDWSGPLPFGDGKVDGDSVEFTVGDPIFRLHVRISMMRTDTATLQVWITDEDWLASLAKANRRVRTRRRKALRFRAILKRNLKLRRPVTIGVFIRSQS